MINSPYYQTLIDAANQYGVDPDLATRVAWQESRFNQNATSPTGAQGIMQLEPGTASDLGVDPTDPVQNIHGGVRYLKSMLDRYGGNVPLALAGYNAGPGRADAYAHSGRPLPPETTDYINKITGASAPMAQAMASPMQRAMTGSPSMASDNSQPSLGSRFLAGGPGALFGDPQPDWSLGRGLQGLGAGLIAAGGSPTGGAALMNAANMPLFRSRFSFSRDPLGNPLIFNNRTGQAYQMGANGGFTRLPGASAPSGQTGGAQAGGSPTVGPGPVEATAQSPVARAAAAKTLAEESQKNFAGIQSSAADAQQLKDLIENQAIPYSKDPSVIQGPGEWWKNGAKELGYSLGMDIPSVAKTQDLEKLNSQLVAKSLSAQKGVRFAAPEIKFGQTANADIEKPAATNQQIYANLRDQAQRVMDIAAIARKHMETYGVLGPAFHQEIANYQAQHPMYNPSVISAETGNGKRPPLSSFNK
jgi:soluble lytic murein transglycosylase-like protein